jgi:all-trans-8'-apo-beta-carotenal 15,15'-oxygenase
VPDYAPLLERAFARAPEEASYEVRAVRGAVPDYVRGTWYLNGPARFSRGGLAYRHWLDGDGMVCAVRFEGGRARFTSRYVRTAKLAAEEAAGRPLFRAFGTAFPGDRLKRGLATESPANVSVYPYAGALLAFGENSLPYQLDPVTLATRGPFTFGGQLNEVSPFGAHPKFHAATGDLLNFGVSFSPREPCLHLYRFAGPDRPADRWRLPLPYPCSVHDFALGGRFAVFYLTPYLLDLPRLMRDGHPTLECLTWRPELGSRLLIADAVTGDEVATVPLGRRFCLHLIGAFEEEGRLVVDVIEYDRPLYDQYQPLPWLFADVSRGTPARLLVDVEARQLLERRELDYPLAPDFPAIEPRAAERDPGHFWALGISAAGRPGRKFFDQLALLDWAVGGPRSVYRAPPWHYLAGEPVFVGDPGDGAAGVVLCPLFDAAECRSALALFDAFDLAAGPRATVPLESPIHLGFHASFHPEGLAAGG